MVNTLKFTKDGSLLYKRTKGEKVIYAIVFALFALYTVIMVFPFVWLFISSFKSSYNYFEDVEQFKIMALPTKWIFKNYASAFVKLEHDGTNLLGMGFNSIWYTTVVVVEGVFFSACTGYSLSKYKFKCKNLIYTVAVVSMTIPVVGTLPASFRLSAALKIYDTPLQPIVTCAGGFGFNFLIMYAFFKNLPWSYVEAVFMDGGNDFIAFFKVMLPMAVGPIVTLSIIAAISCWNDYTSIILFMPSYPTIASGLYYVQLNMFDKFPTIYYAALFISMVPVIVVFAIFSEQIMKNMSVGGLKG